jgi:hypothetical protein
MPARSVLVALVLALALSAPASAQGPPASLWDPAAAPEAGGTSHDGGRSAVLLGLGLVALVGAGGVALLAVRAPAMRAPATPGADPSRNGSTPARFVPAAHELPPQRDWHPVPAAGPPPMPAFGPGASSAPPAAPPPPD